MAKNKAELDREEKREEILGAARRLFLETGYELTSISRIAEEASVAPNTIYWYFADKDALLVAVLDSLVNHAAREFQQRGRGTLDTQVTWLLSLFDSSRGLIASVHARASVSEAVGSWHTRFHRTLESALLAWLQAEGVPKEDLGHASRVVMFVAEGLLAHPTSAKDRRALLQWLVAAIKRGG
ncbi:MAG: TetR/AcrR family transcriptional regulator [Myxococcales bacterium]